MKCRYCDQNSIVQVTKLHDMQMSFEKGIQASKADKPIPMCQKHFDEKVWNKK